MVSLSRAKSWVNTQGFHSQYRFGGLTWNKMIYLLAWITTFCHSWGDAAMNVTRDFVTRENHCRIASLVPKSVTHANSHTHTYIYTYFYFLFKPGFQWFHIIFTQQITSFQIADGLCKNLTAHRVLSHINHSPQSHSCCLSEYCLLMFQNKCAHSN